MRRKSNIEKKIVTLTTVTCVLIAIIFSIYTANKAQKPDIEKCYSEKVLAFEGVISNYKTDVLAEKSTFLLNDSVQFSIPRNIKEMYLNDGDTITKIKDSNIYVVKRSNSYKWQEHKSIDTFRFGCLPTKTSANSVFIKIVAGH